MRYFHTCISTDTNSGMNYRKFQLYNKIYETAHP